MDQIQSPNCKVLHSTDKRPSWLVLSMKRNKAKRTLFPPLFILAREGLSKMLDKARTNHWIGHFKMESNPNHSISVSHLLYANDNLYFMGLRHFKSYISIWLMLFEAISGLHINTTKSKICNVNENPNLSDLAKILGVCHRFFPFHLLRSPLECKLQSNWGMELSDGKGGKQGWQTSKSSFCPLVVGWL